MYYGCRKHITAQQILKHWNGKKTFNFFKSLLVACLMVIYSALFAWLFILFSLRSSLLPSTLFFFHHFSPFSDVESCQIGASGWNIVLRRRNSSFVSFLSLSRLGRDDKCWLNITRDMNVNSSDKFLALKFVPFSPFLLAIAMFTVNICARSERFNRCCCLFTNAVELTKEKHKIFDFETRIGDGNFFTRWITFQLFPLCF